MTIQLCGSHLHFYACTCRGPRPAPEMSNTKRKAPKPERPYECLADPKTYRRCPRADADGSRHAQAGITIHRRKP